MHIGPSPRAVRCSPSCYLGGRVVAKKKAKKAVKKPVKKVAKKAVKKVAKKAVKKVARKKKAAKK